MSEGKKEFSLGKNNNLAIKASAGTGKTFRLAMRFIALLFLDKALKPEQIVAITFTRKAAAEILDKIIEQLLYLKKSGNQANLDSLKSDGLLPPTFTQADIPGILKQILTARELQISTIDSFLVKIIQAHAPEFGISGAVEMIDESRDSGVKENIAELIRQDEGTLASALRDYAQGKEARNFTSMLEDFLSDNYDTYLLYPDEKLWGNLPDTEGELSAEEERDLIIDVSKIIDQHPYRVQGIVNRIKKIITAVQTGGEPEDSFPAIEGNGNDLHFRFGTGTYKISSEMAEGIRKLSLHIAVRNLHKKIKKSQAAYQILNDYDSIYSANVRSTGRLTFRDIPKVLGELAPEKKLNLEYRMDTKNLHYMLDEFQDTSTQQWAFMSNLMNEAITGTDQSFFMVGDVKQSLYQWRFGNPKLFDAICKHYNRDGIFQETLEDSRRSEPEIIAAVNDVFDTPNRQKIVNNAVREAIERLQFKKHNAVKEDPGYVRLQQFAKTNNEERVQERAKKILKILEETKPFEHRRSVAILLRTNKEIASYKKCLRDLDKNLPISTEGAIQPQDSMACTFLTLLLRLAAHPSDPMARGALPLLSWSNSAPFTALEISQKMQLPCSADYDVLSANLRVLLEEVGIHGIVSRFQAVYSAQLSEFDRDCLAVAATQAVDFTGSIDDYLASLEKAKGIGVSVENTVQIMTIHKSKGLEFTMVILPELGTSREDGEHLEIAPMNEIQTQSYSSEGKDCLSPDFISYLPVGFARQFLPDVEQLYQKIRADKLYEKVCNLYVAMTRAERALYMFVDNEIGKNGSSFRADQLLVQTLANPPDENDILYSQGKADWYSHQTKEEEKKEKQEQKTPGKINLTALSAKRPVIPVWYSPSRHLAQDEVENTSAIRPEYRFDGNSAAELGTRIHAMFEAVEYLDSIDPENIRTIAGTGEIAREAWQIWEKAISPGGEIAHVLTRPKETTVLWREREFLLQAPDGKLLSGCLDRVEIVYDDTGVIQQAKIYDYKSDALENESDFLLRHSNQLNAYRMALAQMLVLPEEKIACMILALRIGKVIPVD